MATNFRINSITLNTATSDATYLFTEPVTVISGPVGTGKSSLLMLLKYALGGNGVLTPAVKQNVLNVVIEAQLGGQKIALRRAIAGDSSTVELLESGSLLFERRIPISAPRDEMSLSDFMLDLLSFPREEIASRREGAAQSVRLTFYDLYRYIFLQAREIDRQVVGHLDTWFEPKRKELFRLMFGLTNSDVMAMKRHYNELGDSLKASEAEMKAISGFLSQSDPRSDDQLRIELQSLRDQLTRAEASLHNLRKGIEEHTAADAVLRADLQGAIASAQQASENALASREVLDSRRAVVAQLELDLARLDRSSVAVQKLAPIAFVVCPRCMQRLDNRVVEDACCNVCLQPDPLNEEVDLSAIDSARETLLQQLEDARTLLMADQGNYEESVARAQSSSFLVTSLRQRLDALTRNLVAPRFDAIAEASARVAALHAQIDAITQLREFWARVRVIEKRIVDLKAERRNLNRSIKERSAQLSERRNLVRLLSGEFSELVQALDIPWVNSASIDPDSFLPVLNGGPFEELQASGGGIATAVNVAYSLSILAFGLNRNDVLTPSCSIIDSPRKAFGANESDRRLGERIYRRFETLGGVQPDKVQLIVADNDAAPIIGRSFGTIRFDYDNPMVPGVVHPGPERIRRVEDVEDAGGGIV